MIYLEEISNGKKSRLVVFVITVFDHTDTDCDLPIRSQNVKLGLDFTGGFEILYEVSPLEGKKLPSMTAVLEIRVKNVSMFMGVQ